MTDLRIENNVLIGEDDELFLASEERRTLDYMRGAIPPSERSIEAFVGNLESRKRLCEAAGVRYFHLCAPDKHMVYSEQVPCEIEFSFGEYFLHRSDYGFVYPKDYLRSFLPERIYRRVDTHWSLLGRTVIAALVAERFGRDPEAVKLGLDLMRLCIEPGEGRSDGDLGSKLMPPQDEPTENFRPYWEVKSFNNGLSNGNDGMMECVFSNNEHASGRLLIFGDSYAFQTLPMLSFYFKEILCCRTRYLHREILELARPDYVLSENVERYFSGIYTDEIAPPFAMLTGLRGRLANTTREAAEAFSFLMAANPTPYRRAVEFAHPVAHAPAELLARIEVAKGGETPEWLIALDEGKAALAVGEFATAAQKLRGVVEAAPDHVEAWNDLGIAYAELERDEEAVGALRRAIGLDPSAAHVHRRLGKLLRKLKQHREAEVAFAAFSSLKPNDPAGHHDLGRALMSVDRFDAAIRSFKETLRLRPDRVVVYRDLAVCYKMKRKWAEAAAACETYRAHEDDNIDVMLDHGLALLELGRAQEALGAYDAALACDASVVGARHGRGRALAALGRKEEARVAFEEELHLHPTHVLTYLEIGKLKAPDAA